MCGEIRQKAEAMDERIAWARLAEMLSGAEMRVMAWCLGKSDATGVVREDAGAIGAALGMSRAAVSRAINGTGGRGSGGLVAARVLHREGRRLRVDSSLCSGGPMYVMSNSAGQAPPIGGASPADPARPLLPARTPAAAPAPARPAASMTDPLVRRMVEDIGLRLVEKVPSQWSATSLIREFTREYVAAQLAHLDKQNQRAIQAGRADGVGIGPGRLIAACREDWAKVNARRELDKRKAERAAAERAERQARASERTAAAMTELERLQAQRAERAAELALIDGASPGEVAEAVAVALAALPAGSIKLRIARDPPRVAAANLAIRARVVAAIEAARSPAPRVIPAETIP